MSGFVFSSRGTSPITAIRIQRRTTKNVDRYLNGRIAKYRNLKIVYFDSYTSTKSSSRKIVYFLQNNCVLSLGLQVPKSWRSYTFSHRRILSVLPQRFDKQHFLQLCYRTFEHYNGHLPSGFTSDWHKKSDFSSENCQRIPYNFLIEVI